MSLPRNTPNGERQAEPRVFKMERDGATVEVWANGTVKIEVGGSVHVRSPKEWHAAAVASFARSETAETEGYQGIAHDFETMRRALMIAQNTLRRWTDLYALLQNECGEVVSRKLDRILPPADHVRAMEDIDDALKIAPSAQSETTEKACHHCGRCPRACTDPAVCEYNTGTQSAARFGCSENRAGCTGEPCKYPNDTGTRCHPQFLFPHPDAPDVEWSKGAFDIEGYIASLKWTDSATEHEKALVAGNLRRLFAVVKEAHNAAVREAGRIERELHALRSSAPSSARFASDVEAAIKSVVSVVHYDVRDAAEKDIRALLDSTSKAALAAEYTRGREDGFDAGKLSAAPAAAEKIDKLTWQVRDTCARAERAEGILRLAQGALRQWTDKYAHLQNECGERVSRVLDYNLPPADHLRTLEAIEEHFKAGPSSPPCATPERCNFPECQRPGSPCGDDGYESGTASATGEKS